MVTPDSSTSSDTNSRYYIHHGENPNQSLVTELLNGENYATWSRSVQMALSAKNKLGFINGKFEAPSSTKQPDEYESWERCNNMILSWLAHSVAPDLASSVVFASTAHEVWEDFRERFAQGNAPRIYQIQKAIASHTQDTSTVAAYFTKLKSYWDELSVYRPPPTSQHTEVQAIEKQKEQDRLMQFLMGLNESYNAVRGQLLLMQSLPNVREAYNFVTQEEKQREIGNNSIAENFSVAAAVRNFKNSNNKFSGNSFSHSSSNSNSEGLFCRYCKKDTHKIETCPKLHGYPPGHPRHDPNFKSKAR
ncbi:unnamed protein product [Prunus brigantina]